MTSRILIKKLITEDLHYCCLFAFFKLFKKTGVIADRLGMTPRAVRYHRAAMKRGEYQCCKADRCLREKKLV